MKSKKAWLRIVEASIAVLIIASVLFVMISRAPIDSNEKQIRETQRFVLEQINKNNSLRKQILQYDFSPPPNPILTELENSIREILPPNLDFDVRICGVGDVCGMSSYPDRREVFADEILVTSTLTDYKPRKVKLYVWVR
jgi:hypothetical protein